jgi:hypothetical protein
MEDPEHRIFYKITKDGHYIHRSYERKGYGAYCIVFDDAPNVFGSFSKPLSTKDIAKFEEYVSQPDVISESSYLTRWNDDTNEVEAVVGTIINPFAEYEDEIPDSGQ